MLELSAVCTCRFAYLSPIVACCEPHFIDKGNTMAFSDILAKTTIASEFSKEDKATIESVLKTAYEGSPTAQKLFDDWIAKGQTITVEFLADKFQVSGKTNHLQIDLKWLNGNSYISPTGDVVVDTPLSAIVHELGHAIGGWADPDSSNDADWVGENPKNVNKIYDELKIPRQVSYFAYDVGDPALHKPSYHYTNGDAIDKAITGDKADMGFSSFNDSILLIGGSSANKFQTGSGNDFLVGAGGNDMLFGGSGFDTAVYYGSSLDYDIRTNEDGTWTVKQQRGSTDEGTDILTNIEQIQFGNGDRYALTKKGLTFQTDLALVIDTTSSMTPYIAGVKKQASSIIDSLLGAGTIDARIGVVGFKDTTNSEPTSILLPFTDQKTFAERKAAALDAINKISVSGGGDTPETAFDGLLKALDGTMGQWRSGAGVHRIAIFTDAPPKDFNLAPKVLAYAFNIGTSISINSKLVGTNGMVDTFTIETTTTDASAIARAEPPGTVAAPPVVPEAVVKDTTKAQLEIYTIFSGGDFVNKDEFTKLASDTGGKVLAASSGDDVAKALLQIINIPVGQTFRGTAGDDTFVGGNGNDTFTGEDGRDTFTGSGGNDTIDGGKSVDTAIFSGNRENYTILKTATSFTVKDSVGTNGTDTLSNVERLSFANAYVALDVGGAPGQLFRLYQTAFDRVPDKAGLGYWIGKSDAGMTLKQVAGFFEASPEFTAKFGANVSDTQFLENLYSHGLHRAADAGGLKFWGDLLAPHTLSRADVLIGFSESSENIANLVGSIQNGVTFA